MMTIKKVASSKKSITNSRLDCKNHTLFRTLMPTMAKIDIPYKQNERKTIPFVAAHMYIAHIWAWEYAPMG